MDVRPLGMRTTVTPLETTKLKGNERKAGRRKKKENLNYDCRNFNHGHRPRNFSVASTIHILFLFVFVCVCVWYVPTCTKVHIGREAQGQYLGVFLDHLPPCVLRECLSRNLPLINSGGLASEFQDLTLSSLPKAGMGASAMPGVYSGSGVQTWALCLHGRLLIN